MNRENPHNVVEREDGIAMNRAWAVILAGGEGTRLRGLTRFLCGEDRPKQFCRLYGGKTLLSHTRDRLAKIIAPKRTIFVVVKAHERFYGPELAGVARSHLVVQPANRGTTAAITASLIRIMALDEDPIVGFFPTDHFYSHEERFVAAVDRAIRAVQQRRNALILLGAKPERAEVEYGWIEPGPARRRSALSGLNERGAHWRAVTSSALRAVRGFWEKPTSPVAEALFARGCLWNTFVMVGRSSAFLSALRAAVPELLNVFEAAPHRAGTGFKEARLRMLYESIPPGDFSRQVLPDCTDMLRVLPMDDAGWNDLGTPARVMESVGKWPDSEIAVSKAHYAYQHRH
jgi:mannose-1-phosphate guanylyltransferase